MTFRVADLMLDPAIARGREKKPDKGPNHHPDKPEKDRDCKGHTHCGHCTLNTDCGVCSRHTDCTACTNCSACTCTRCTLTGASTCTGETDLKDCTCDVRLERNLTTLKAALQSTLEGIAPAA